MSETSVTNLMLACLIARPHSYPYNVEIVARFGFSNEDIATALGITVSQVKLARPNPASSGRAQQVSSSGKHPKAKAHSVRARR